jgi:arylsulfatase A-like enzyme
MTQANVLFLSFCLLAPCVAVPESGTRPNIVLVVADDMRWDAMSCAGNPLLKTPNLDRLAAAGTRFTNAFVTTSICAVSRASILSGQYARRHGVNDFKTQLPDLAATYPLILRKGGYYTGFIGKWGVAAHNNPKEYFQRCAEAFDYWAGDVRQTAYWHERTCNYLTNNGTSERRDFFCSCPPEGRKTDGCGVSGPNPALKDPVHAETEFVPAKIRSFLDQRDAAKPFCLSLSLKAPHGPWQGYAPRFADDFQGAAIPRRDNVTLAEALRQPDFLRRSLESERGLRMVRDATFRNELFAQYYRLIEGVDFCVGEILKELQQRGLADNTLVLFTADNGHFAGEHGFLGKWLIHEESIRVPMIVCGPRLPQARQGRLCEALALNIDIAPTLLELAGQQPPAAMQGRSLVPLLNEQTAPWREDFFYEHLFRNSPEPPTHIEASEGVRTRDWKYIVWIDQTGPAREELYDLRHDPLEMHNLIADPAAREPLERLRRRYLNYTTNLR